MEAKLHRRRTFGRVEAGEILERVEGVETEQHNESFHSVGGDFQLDVNGGDTAEEVARAHSLRQMASGRRAEEEETMLTKRFWMGVKSLSKSDNTRETLLRLSTAVAVVMLLGWVIISVPLMVSNYYAYLTRGFKNAWVGCYGGNDYSWPAAASVCNSHAVKDIVYLDGWNIKNSGQEGLITAACCFSQIDIAASSATLGCRLSLYGTYRKNASLTTLSVPTQYDPRSSLVLLLGQTTESYRAGESIRLVSYTVPLGWKSTDKNLFFYPFFEASVELWMSTYWLEPDGSAQDATLAWMFEYDCLRPYTVRAHATYRANEGSSTRLDVVDATIQLHPYFKMFATVLVLTIWLLVLSLTLLAIFEAFGSRKTKPSYDLLSAATSLLFSLPFMRGVLPGNPPVGTQYDIYGVLGQLVMITVVCLCLVQHRSKNKL